MYFYFILFYFLHFLFWLCTGEQFLKRLERHVASQDLWSIQVICFGINVAAFGFCSD